MYETRSEVLRAVMMMIRRIDWRIVTKVSKEHSASIVMVEDGNTLFLREVGDFTNRHGGTRQKP